MFSSFLYISWYSFLGAYIIDGEKNTQIYAPDFYPEYSSIYYTISLFMPFIDNEQTKLFRSNSSKIEYWDCFTSQLLCLLLLIAYYLKVSNSNINET